MVTTVDALRIENVVFNYMLEYNRLVKIANRKGAPDKARRKAEEARNRLGQVIAARDALVGSPPLDP